MRLRIDCAYDCTDFSGWATQPGPAHGAGDAGGRPCRGPADARGAGTSRAVPSGGPRPRQVAHADVARVAARSAGRSTTCRSTRCPPTPTGSRPPTCAYAGSARRRRASTPGSQRPGAIRLPDRRRPGAGRPAGAPPRACFPRRLDLDPMNAASTPLVGLQDFAAFCKRREGATTVRTLLDLVLEPRRGRPGRRVGPRRRVLPQHGARARRQPDRRGRGPAADDLAGRGDGRAPPRPGVRVVHAHGLTLEEVGYPDDAELAAQAERARAKREAIDA